jgi:predicted enzyme related to lactoylglutathione lyase
MLITGVHQVVLNVQDQERALHFWVEVIGFELVKDEHLGDERWIELRPPSGNPVLVLSARSNGDTRSEVPDHLPHSNVFFTSDDIQQTHRELAERRVRFPTPPTKMPWGWWAMFEDPEGTRFALGQQ